MSLGLLGQANRRAGSPAVAWPPSLSAPPNEHRDTEAAAASHGGVFTGATMAASPPPLAVCSIEPYEKHMHSQPTPDSRRTYS